jgi:hypothetical protein
VPLTAEHCNQSLLLQWRELVPCLLEGPIKALDSSLEGDLTLTCCHETAAARRVYCDARRKTRKKPRLTTECRMVRNVDCGVLQCESRLLAVSTRREFPVSNACYFVRQTMIFIVKYGINSRFRHNIVRFEDCHFGFPRFGFPSNGIPRPQPRPKARGFRNG